MFPPFRSVCVSREAASRERFPQPSASDLSPGLTRRFAFLCLLYSSVLPDATTHVLVLQKQSLTDGSGLGGGASAASMCPTAEDRGFAHDSD